MYITNENSTVVPFLSPILPKLARKIIMLNIVLPLYWYFFIPYGMMFLIITLIPILLLLEWLIESMVNCTCPDCMSERNIFKHFRNRKCWGKSSKIVDSDEYFTFQENKAQRILISQNSLLLMKMWWNTHQLLNLTHHPKFRCTAEFTKSQ